jgi:hypothetical protein
MSEILKKIANSMPNLKNMNIDLKLKGETPNILALQGMLNIGQKMYETKEDVIQEQLSTNFKIEDMEFQKEWLSDPLKLRDEDFRKQMLDSKNSLIGKQQKTISDSDLSKENREALINKFKLESENSLFSMSKILIEQENAVELEKRVSLFSTAKMLVNSPTSNIEERTGNLKRMRQSADLLKPFKTKEEINNMKVTGFLEGAIKQDMYDFEKSISNPLLTKKDKLETLKKYRSTFASKENINGLVEQASDVMGVDSKDARLLIEASKNDVLLKIDAKTEGFLELIEKQEITNAKKRKTEQDAMEIERLKVQIEEKKLTNSKLKDLRTDDGSINTSVQANNELRAYNISTGINITPAQMFSDPVKVKNAYGVSMNQIANQDKGPFKSINVIDDRIIGQYSQQMIKVKLDGGTEADILDQVIYPMLENQLGDDEDAKEIALRSISQNGIIKDDRIIQMKQNKIDADTVGSYARNMNLASNVKSKASTLNFINGRTDGGITGELSKMMVIYNDDGSINYGATDDLKFNLTGMVTNGTLPFPEDGSIKIIDMARAYNSNKVLWDNKIKEQKNLIKNYPVREFERVHINNEHLYMNNNIRINEDPKYTEDIILKAGGNVRAIEVKAGNIQYKERTPVVEKPIVEQEGPKTKLNLNKFYN